MANHTSMIDFIVLEQMTAFAVIMQKHPGWVGECIYYAKYVNEDFGCRNKSGVIERDTLDINNQ